MTNNAGQIIAYDGENRPIDIGGVDFVYGPDGQRLKKIDGNAVTLYLGADVELNQGPPGQGGGTWTKYLPGDALKVGSTTSWLHRDHLGSVRVYTNNTGAVAKRANYRPYGERLATAGILSESKGFIGQRHDDETGLIYLNARYYDPVLARFIQPDPLNPAISGVDVNRYAYGMNNPIMMLDPSGLTGGDMDRNPGMNAHDTEAAQSPHGDNVPDGDGSESCHGCPGWQASWPNYDIFGWSNPTTTVGVDAVYFNGVLIAEWLGDAWQVYDAGAWMAFTGQTLVAGYEDYSPDELGWHEFMIASEQCLGCTAEEMADMLSRYAFPGQNPAVPVQYGGVYSVYDPVYDIYAGEVVVLVSNDGLTVTNITLAEHIFYNGEIVRAATLNSDGSWTVTTHGYGNNVIPGMNYANELLGPEAFSVVDEQMRSYEPFSGEYGDGY